MKQSVFNSFLKLFLPLSDRKNVEIRGMQDFYNINLDFVSKTLKENPPSFWERQGEKMALTLFKETSKRVPAYKDFLNKNGIKSSLIKTIDDFKNVPYIDKDNYLRAYKTRELCWDGKIENNTLFSVSSGSSGVPFFWPRSDNLELETSITHGLILKEILGAGKNTTLFINSFSMGIYIAGVVILNSALRCSQLELPISIMTPGLEVQDVLRTVKELGRQYEQVIIAGYPPFVKDIIDIGELEGVEWKEMNIKFLFAAENFSEEFRDYMLKKVGQKNIFKSSVNIYGSADASILAHETPLTILLRKLSLQNKGLFEDLFGNMQYLPTFAQYNPILKFFEKINNELVFSAYGGIPLVRYNIHDSGKILGFEELYHMKSVMQKIKLVEAKKDSWKLPFLFVQGKSDFTISFYGLKIYPENIRAGLEGEKVSNFVSGKFTMMLKNKKNQSQYWGINIELKEGVKKTDKLKQAIFQSIVLTLKKKNLEYSRLEAALGKRAHPDIDLFAKGDPEYFNPQSVKQRWSKKSK